MLIATLVLAFVSFVAFVNYILNPATWSLVLLFSSAGLGLILFVIDWLSKQRHDKAKKDQAEAFDALSASHADQEVEEEAALKKSGTRSHSREFPGIGKTTSDPGSPNEQPPAP